MKYIKSIILTAITSTALLFSGCGSSGTTSDEPLLGGDSGGGSSGDSSTIELSAGEGIVQVGTNYTDRLYVSGWAEDTDGEKYVSVWCYESDGTRCPDTGYNNGQTLLNTIDGAYEEIHRLAFGNTDQLYISGALYDAENTNWDIALWNFNVNGELNTSFNSDGYDVQDSISSVGGSDVWDGAMSVAVGNSGQVYMVGYSQTGPRNGLPNDKEIVLLNYDANGDLNTSFGYNIEDDYNTQTQTNNGISTYSYGNSDSSADGGKAVAVGSDNKIYVAGHMLHTPDSETTNQNNVVILRFNTNGSLDDTFGSGGRTLIPTGYMQNGSDGDAYVKDMTIGEDGSIYLAGDRYNASNDDHDVFVYKLDNKGNLDSTFGSNGLAVWDSGKYERATGIKIGEILTGDPIFVSAISDGKATLLLIPADGNTTNAEVHFQQGNTSTPSTELYTNSTLKKVEDSTVTYSYGLDLVVRGATIFMTGSYLDESYNEHETLWIYALD